MVSFAHIKKHVVGKLEKELPRDLTYHNIAHTLDVLKQVNEIGKSEGIIDEQQFLLLRIAALYHDTGFINVYKGHEERSCEIASEDLPAFGFSAGDIKKICSLIRATRVPQLPQDLLEEIICDSDLDYLGRDDFFEIGKGLYKEFRDQKIVESENDWNLLQVRFLESHRFFTDTSIRRRQHQKQVHLELIKRKLVI